jgi:hypothetical protein
MSLSLLGAGRSGGSSASSVTKSVRIVYGITNTITKTVQIVYNIGDDVTANYYVSTSGSDSNPGTISQPFLTFSKADTTATTGQTIAVRGGTYGALGQTRTFNKAGVTWMAYPGETVTLLGHTRINANNTRFTGFLFDGPTGQILTPSGSNPLGEEVLIYIAGADGVEIDHCEIRDCLWHAGIFLATADDVLIHHNYIHTNGNKDRPEQANVDHGIYFGSGNNGQIYNNLIANNYTYGVQLYSGPTNAKVYNNTIVDNDRGGVIYGDSAANCLVINNIIANNSQYGIRTSGLGGTGNVAENNIVYNHTDNLGTTTGLTLTNNITSNPVFVSSTDFHLQASSPAIGLASGAYIPADDYEDHARDVDPDNGAFEYA